MGSSSARAWGAKLMADGMDMAARAAATQAVIERFRVRPFDWSKQATCIHLVRAQLAAMGAKVPPVRRFRSALGARKALQAMGFATLGELMDAYATRIPPARMIVGDIAMLAGEPRDGGFEALALAVGGSKVVGWHGLDASRLHPIEVTGGEIAAAWTDRAVIW